MSTRLLTLTLLAVPLAASADGQSVRVASAQKITEHHGGFSGPLKAESRFGIGLAEIGDLDGDGVTDLVVGARSHELTPTNAPGAIWVLFMSPDGTVKAEQMISAGIGGFDGVLPHGSHFGASIAALGDLDGDGVVDVCVGSDFDSDGGHATGAVWILFLNADGTVKGEQKVSDLQGGLEGVLPGGRRFGLAATELGDLDGDGVTDIAVGAPFDDDGAPGAGAVWVLFLDVDGTVKGHQKISAAAGGFTGPLDAADHIGNGVHGPGDLDGDGVEDLLVGAGGDDDDSPDAGAVWVLYLNADGTVKSHAKILGSIAGSNFGASMDSAGDLDGDGTEDLVVAAVNDADGGPGSGAIWVLFMNADETVKAREKISATEGCFRPDRTGLEFFGAALTVLGDDDFDGRVEIAVGEYFDSEVHPRAGAFWTLELDVRATVGRRFCKVGVNSTGEAATLVGHGSRKLANDCLTLITGNLPPGETTYLVFSQSRDVKPRDVFGKARFCVGKPKLLDVRDSGAGAVSVDLDFATLPFLPGETWYFQSWYSDIGPGKVSNTSSALRVTFR